MLHLRAVKTTFSVRVYSVFVFKHLPQAIKVKILLTQCAGLTWCASLLAFPSPSSPCGCLRPSGPWELLRLVMGQGSLRYSDTTCKMQDTSSGTAMPSASRICHFNPCHDTDKCVCFHHCCQQKSNETSDKHSLLKLGIKYKVKCGCKHYKPFFM